LILSQFWRLEVWDQGLASLFSSEISFLILQMTAFTLRAPHGGTLIWYLWLSLSLCACVYT
jgi:hypothetical protein